MAVSLLFSIMLTAGHFVALHGKECVDDLDPVCRGGDVEGEGFIQMDLHNIEAIKSTSLVCEAGWQDIGNDECSKVVLPAAGDSAQSLVGGTELAFVEAAELICRANFARVGIPETKAQFYAVRKDILTMHDAEEFGVGALLSAVSIFTGIGIHSSTNALCLMDDTVVAVADIFAKPSTLDALDPPSTPTDWNFYAIKAQPFQAELVNAEHEFTGVLCTRPKHVGSPPGDLSAFPQLSTCAHGTIRTEDVLHQKCLSIVAFTPADGSSLTDVTTLAITTCGADAKRMATIPSQAINDWIASQLATDEIAIVGGYASKASGSDQITVVWDQAPSSAPRLPESCPSYTNFAASNPKVDADANTERIFVKDDGTWVSGANSVDASELPTHVVCEFAAPAAGLT